MKGCAQGRVYIRPSYIYEREREVSMPCIIRIYTYERESERERDTHRDREIGRERKRERERVLGTA